MLSVHISFLFSNKILLCYQSYDLIKDIGLIFKCMHYSYRLFVIFPILTGSDWVLLFINVNSFQILFCLTVFLHIGSIIKKTVCVNQQVYCVYSRTTARSLCVLVPVTGVPWIFGVFYVNETAVVMQYIFCVCNGLQVKYATVHRLWMCETK